MDPGSWANECVVLLLSWRSGVAKKTGGVWCGAVELWSCGIKREANGAQGWLQDFGERFYS
jgi:hypothetical protein